MNVNAATIDRSALIRAGLSYEGEGESIKIKQVAVFATFCAILKIIADFVPPLFARFPNPAKSQIT
jgi:hypothetical protein